MKDHKDNKITWQAHTVLKVNEDCLNNGKFPNGKKLTGKDIDEIKESNKVCREILINYGCIDSQLKLF